MYWSAAGLVIHNYASSRQIGASPEVVRLLERLDGWTTAGSLAAALKSTDAGVIRTWLDRLSELSLVDRSDRPASRTEAVLAGGWRPWSPAAAFFHLATKNPPYSHPELNEQELLAKSQAHPPPRPTRRWKRARTIPLRPPELPSPLAEPLLARRTWRRFGGGAVSSAQLATLLGLTFGVRAWSDVGSRGRFPLKTAPSGGARHNLEAYVVALRVADVDPGIYHYDGNSHVLRLVRRQPEGPKVSTYVPWQTWYDEASVLIFMSAVFERAQWKYSHPRTYRSVLFEAGHFCQNFLLVATALGLAPFCTGALADDIIERDLRIDGISESVIYACGVGTRPAGVGWAPWPDTEATPRLIPPAWARRTRNR